MKNILCLLFLVLIISNFAHAEIITLTFDNPDTLSQYQTDYNLLFERSQIVNEKLQPTHTSSTGPILINFLDDAVGEISFDFTPHMRYGI